MSAIFWECSEQTLLRLELCHFFQPTPLSVARRLFSNGLAVDIEPEEGNPGVFRRVIKSGLLTALSVMFRARRGNPGAVSRIPTRLRRPSTFQQNQVGAIRPISGDVVRNDGLYEAVLTSDLLLLRFVGVHLMAVTISVIQLAAALRIGDGVTPLVEPQAGVLNRILASATALVESYAPNAPESIMNEAAIRTGGYLFDAPPGGGVRFGQSVIRLRRTRHCWRGFVSFAQCW